MGIAHFALVLSFALQARLQPAPQPRSLAKPMKPDTSFMFLTNINNSKCAGILISKDYILTAAHCLILEGKGYVINSKMGKAEICEQFIHPEWDEQRAKNDIGLIKLCEPLKEGKVATLAKEADEVNIVGEMGSAIGWFFDELEESLETNILLYKVMSNMQCNLEVSFEVGNGTICAVDETNFGKTFTSGSAFLYDEKVIGFVTFGPVNKLNVIGFTSVPYYLDWIHNICGDL